MKFILDLAVQYSKSVHLMAMEMFTSQWCNLAIYKKCAYYQILEENSINLLIKEFHFDNVFSLKIDILYFIFCL